MDPVENLIADVYDTQLKEVDSKGYAEVYKICTEQFIEKLETFGEEHFHVKDVEYKGGYFIFAMGTNSVVSFHVEECPGWLFGIWWSIVEESNEVNISFFTQYEDSIDKFKPSASMFCVDSSYWAKLDGTTISEIVTFSKFYSIVRYIYQVPELAFCREHFYYDYNTEYLSLEDAKLKYKETIERCNTKKRVTSELDKELLDFYRRKVVPNIKDSFIVDRGENWIPQYDLRVPISSVVIDIAGTGVYALEPFLDSKTFEQLRGCYSCLEERAEYHDFIWYAPIDMNIHVFNSSEGD